MLFLGLDYGRKKIGLALSEGTLASPYKVLTVKSLTDAVSQIKKILTEEKIDMIIIGKPESGQALRMTQKFISQIKKETKVSVLETDETLSTYKANLLIQNFGGRKDWEDAYAAAVILQNYLDKQS